MKALTTTVEPAHRLQAEHLQELVDHAELRVEHAAPDQRGDVVRDGPGQDQQHAVDGLALEPFRVQCQGQQEAEGDSDGDVGDRPDHRHHQRPVEVGVVHHRAFDAAAHDVEVAQDRDEVLQPDPALPEGQLLVEQRGVGEGQRDAVEEREEHQHQHAQHGRRDVGIGGGVVAQRPG
jgi:hypothetical protein